MKHFIWYVAFLALLFTGDRLAGWLLQRETMASQFRYSRLYSGRAGADLLLVGNSRGLTFYAPYIEQSTGQSTCNLSYNGLPMDVANALIQDYLEHYPAPKTLLLDITICDRANNELLAGFAMYAPFSPRLSGLIRDSLPKMWGGNQFSHLTRFNNEIFQRALFHRKKSDKDWLLDRVIPSKLVAEVAQQQYPLEVHPQLVTSLQAAVQAAQAKGVQVQLVISPYFPGFAQNVTNLDALKTAVEQATGLPVHDYRQALSDPGDFGDFMHPNRVGSIHYIDLLRKDGLLP
ncbi:MAG: hypothetical protein LH618_14470 [Saprospiraceae bacterium]|nr:hypothetical protein [Saprospiraceae bacterium]